MKRIIATLSAAAALLFVSVAPVSADDDNAGQPPPDGHTSCSVQGWFRHVDVEGATFNLQTDYTWQCDDGEVITTAHSESYPTPTQASTNRHCRSHTDQAKQVRPQKFRYVTRLITDCDNTSRERVLHRTHWHHR